MKFNNREKEKYIINNLKRNNMKKRNYELLKQQLESIKEIEDAYTPALAKGEDPEIDGRTYREAILDQAGILVISLEEVLEDEEDHLVD